MAPRDIQAHQDLLDIKVIEVILDQEEKKEILALKGL